MNADGKIERLGIYPIKNVIFPAAALSVFIYEKKYIETINFSVNESGFFGTNLEDNGKMRDCGCAVKIEKELEYYGGGKAKYLLRGYFRYYVKSVETIEGGTTIAEIEPFDDIVDSYDEILLKTCVAKYNEIIGYLSDAASRTINARNFGRGKPSFVLAQRSGLTRDQKYKLLEKRSENKRLEFLLEHYEQIAPLLREKNGGEIIIGNDGYYDSR